MGNPNAAKVPRKGPIQLNFSSGQKSTLLIVLHDPETRQNLVYTSCVNMLKEFC